jgi:hypothetical protein
MVVGPGVEVKAIEGDAAIADRDFGEERAHLGIEPVAVHAQIRRRVAVPDQSGNDGHRHNAHRPRYIAVICPRPCPSSSEISSRAR